MNFKSYKPYTLANDAFLFQLFSELPSNAFINKGRCGNGGTTLEIRNKKRSSIISVPNVIIVLDKAEQHPEVLAVYGKTGLEEIMIFLRRREIGQKIITTADGVAKIMKAVESCQMTKEIYDTWFLLLDEAHSFISEDYRDGILAPFDHFYIFKNKSMISATPYFFSDPRMKSLDYVHVEISGTIGTVKLVEAISVKATLIELINQSKLDESKLFIFYNSVRGIASLIDCCGLTDCNVYCSFDKEGKNEKTLGKHAHFMQERPKTGEYAKINFITTTAFEGWDMCKESNVKLIVATDIHNSHSLVSIDKCFQAFGRFRMDTSVKNENVSFYHVFNHYNMTNFRTIEFYTNNYTQEANRILNGHFELLERQKATGIQLTKDERLKAYCRNPDHEDPEIDYNLLDRVINHQNSIEVYNNVEYVRKAWMDRNYEVEQTKSYLSYKSSRDEKRTSSADRLKDDYLAVKAIMEESDRFTISNEIEMIEKRNPLAIKAIKYLNQQDMERFNYNFIKVQQETIKREESTNQAKAIKTVATYFKRGDRYTKTKIKDVIQSIYDDLKLYDKNGKGRLAKATHIKLFFDVNECKIKGKSGAMQNGYELLRPTFSMAAVN